MTLAKAHVLVAFSINELKMSKHAIRDRVEFLLEDLRFIYKVFFFCLILVFSILIPLSKDPDNKTGMFLAEIIQLLVNKMWFRDKDDEGVVHPEFSEGGLLSRVTVALVLTAVHLLFFFYFYSC